MIISPYGAQVTKHHILGPTQDKLVAALSHGELCFLEDAGKNVVFVVGAKDAVIDIPLFGHPIEIQAVGGEKYMACDIRSMASERRSVKDQPVVRQRSEFSFMVRRAILQRAWNEGEFGELKNISKMPIAIFAQWVSEAITRQLHVDPQVQLELRVLSAFYYLCLFSLPVAHTDERERLKYAVQISNALSYRNVDEIMRIIEGVGHLENLDQFCKAVVGKGFSVRLERLAPGLLITWLVMSWYGTSAREVAAVALEHPPTFLAMVFSSITDRGYRKTRLAEMILRNYDNGTAFRDFETAFGSVISKWR